MYLVTIFKLGKSEQVSKFKDNLVCAINSAVNTASQQIHSARQGSLVFFFLQKKNFILIPSNESYADDIILNNPCGTDDSIFIWSSHPAEQRNL